MPPSRFLINNKQTKKKRFIHSYNIITPPSLINKGKKNYIYTHADDQPFNIEDKIKDGRYMIYFNLIVLQ